MPVVAAVAFALAIACGIPPSGMGRLERPPAVRATAAPRGLPLAIGSLAALAGGFALGGLRVGVLVGCGLMATATVGWQLAGALRDRRRRALLDDVARFCDALDSELRLGTHPVAAVDAAVRDIDSLASLAGATEVGQDVSGALLSLSFTPGLEALGRLARAWAVCVATGAALGTVLLDVGDAVRAARETRRLVTTELSGARATSRMLGLLPVGGLGLGYLFGGDPLAYLTSSIPGLASLALGVGLTCCGLIWSDALARRAGGS
jgi:tight adherence protein B